MGSGCGVRLGKKAPQGGQGRFQGEGAETRERWISAGRKRQVPGRAPSGTQGSKVDAEEEKMEREQQNLVAPCEGVSDSSPFHGEIVH